MSKLSLPLWLPSIMNYIPVNGQNRPFPPLVLFCQIFGHRDKKNKQIRFKEGLPKHENHAYKLVNKGWHTVSGAVNKRWALYRSQKHVLQITTMRHILKSFGGRCGDNPDGGRSGTEREAPQAPLTPRGVLIHCTHVWSDMAPGIWVQQHKEPKARVVAASSVFMESPQGIRPSPTGTQTGSWTGESDSAKQCWLHPNLPLNA